MGVGGLGFGHFDVVISLAIAVNVGAWAFEKLSIQIFRQYWVSVDWGFGDGDIVLL